MVRSVHVHALLYHDQTHHQELKARKGQGPSYRSQLNITGAIRKKSSGKCLEKGKPKHLLSAAFYQYDIRSQEMRTRLGKNQSKKSLFNQK